MEIHIKLDDPQVCDGCPCLRNDDIYVGCNLGYIGEEFTTPDCGGWPLGWPGVYARPRECSANHGV